MTSHIVRTIKDIIKGDLGGDAENDFSIGAVQVELSGFDKKLAEKYGYLYSLWTNTNTLYYDKKNSRWLSNKEYIATISKKASLRQKQSWWMSNLSNFALIILCSVGIFIIYIKNKAYMATALQKQEQGMDKYDIAVQQSEKALQLSEETNKLLKEILDVLKSKNESMQRNR